MALNDLGFLLFFIPIFLVLLVLQLLRKKFQAACRAQLVVLLASSIFFACYSDIRFGICVVLLTMVSYAAGRGIEKSSTRKRFWAVGGGIVCVGILGYFKYCNFFISSFCRLIGRDFVALDIMVPVGISFYTFTALGYMIDVYRGEYQAERNIIDYALFISFFPKLVAGPIVRGGDFFPQVKDYGGLKIKNFEEGIQIFVFGLFKKMVLADHLGVFVDDVFRAPGMFNTGTVALAVASYSLQIYFDFSGYSDMAVGIAGILGFRFERNFNLPYIAENPSDFWKRWHISLSSWFMDYLYIPLGGNRKGVVRTCGNLLVVMLVSGLWHGAGWTFVIWGLLHGIVSCIHREWRRRHSGREKSVLRKVLDISGMFITVSLLWVIFRAADLMNALDVFKSLFTVHGGVAQPYTWSFFALACLIAATAAAFCRKREGGHTDGFYPLLDLRKFWPLVAFFTFCGLTVMMGYFGNTAFIYGKF